MGMTPFCQSCQLVPSHFCAISLGFSYFSNPIMNNFTVRSPELLEQKLARFTFDTTRVVADFDGTITSHNGKTSWSLFADS